MGATTDSQLYWAALGSVPAIARHLVALGAGSLPPADIWSRLIRGSSRSAGLNPEISRRLSDAARTVDLEGLRSSLDLPGLQVVGWDDPRYPPRLREAEPPVPALYALGDPALLQRPSVAVVGTRKASGYGLAVAEDLARALGEAGLTVISGLAKGIDSAAHTGAVGTRGGTVAVLGCGVDRCYPASGRSLYRRIRQNDLLVAERPPGSEPLKWHFPARNRIIAALGQALVLVEAGERSGATITVDMAIDLGREVYCVPGSIFSPSSRGPHRLIKEGARLLESAAEILDELGLERPAAAEKPTGGLSLAEGVTLGAVGWYPTDLDEVIVASGLAGGEAVGCLALLEIKGYVRMEGSRSYLRIQ